MSEPEPARSGRMNRKPFDDFPKRRGSLLIWLGKGSRNVEKGGHVVREWVAARNQLAIMFAGRFDA